MSFSVGLGAVHVKELAQACHQVGAHVVAVQLFSPQALSFLEFLKLCPESLHGFWPMVIPPTSELLDIKMASDAVFAGHSYMSVIVHFP